MNYFKKTVLALMFLANFQLVHSQDSTAFKLFEKSDGLSGFGGLTFSLLDGDHYLIGGEGAAVFGNYYFGGFGFSGDIGTYVYPLSLADYKLKRSSGGIVIGGVSNTQQIFALYCDMKISFDQYEANSVFESVFLPPFSYRSISLIPSIGVAFRPIYFLQLQLGAGYNHSGTIDDGGLETPPYRAPLFNFNLTFGQF